ncbi:MAG: Uma2 family endonuclease [Caldilineaceae bacterium]|nr:Uma2 family endonuclease [Caldilineaceae bacterium]
MSPISNSREPDLLFVKTENKHYLEEQRLAGVADLVVEVVSAESVKRNNEDKFAEYEAAGVQEYWIIDPRPEQLRAEFWLLDENGQYQSMPVHEKIDHSTVLPGFWLNTEWLWDTERYPALAAFAEIAGLDFRFYWSAIAPVVSLFADGFVALGFFFVFLVFRENSYTSATIEVAENQQVITTGPYSVVRHPMYAGAFVLLLFTPLALGSSMALPFALPLIAVIVVRLREEEEFLLTNLAGYAEYRTQVRARLVPFIW